MPEAAGSAVVTVTGTLAPPPAQDMEVAVSVEGATATEGVDFEPVADLTLTFSAGQAQAVASFTPVPVDDGVHERSEPLKVNKAAPVTGLAVIPATLAITDEAAGTGGEEAVPAPEPVTVNITAAAASVQEGEPARFTVTRSGDATAALTVAVGVSGQGGYLAESAPAEVRFAAQADTAVLVVTTEDDETDEPDGGVTATLAVGTGYVVGSRASATVAVADNDAAPEITIADVRKLESAGHMEFAVELSAASGHQVTVVCTSEDGTATAEQDYAAELGRLVLEPGQTMGVISVPIMDDTLDEMDETFRMMLSEPVNAILTDKEATGTIVDNDDSVVAAWLARFGRTAASHVAEAIGGRLTETRAPRSQATMAGRRLERTAAATPFEPGRERWAVPDPDAGLRTLEIRELLAGSSFDVALAEAQRHDNESAARWAAWGRGAVTQLSGEDGNIAVRGQVGTGVVGADYATGRMVAGLAAAYSDGQGEADVRQSGPQPARTDSLSSWLLSVHPYVSVQVSDRVAVWGLFGYGQGAMSLGQGDATIEAGIAMTMGALGGRGN